MKPTSIIFLIVSILLGLGGIVTMRVAESMAAKEGIEIISETAIDSDDYIFTYEYGSDNIGKISLNIKDAKVNIIGGAAKPYIELINFAEGMYEFSSSNRIITVSNNSDLSSLSAIASMAMNFKGLRGLVNYYNISGREKTINVYLCSEYPVKIIDCKLESGEISVGSSKTLTDYNLELTNGYIDVEDITTSSSMNIVLEDGSLTIKNCVVGDFTADIEKGDVSVITSDLMKIDAEIENGDFHYGYRYRIEYINLDLYTNLGSITIDGESKGGFYEYDQLPTNARYDITIGKGDIVINSNMIEESTYEG